MQQLQQPDRPCAVGMREAEVAGVSKPLSNTCCSTSHKKSAPGSVRCAILLILAPVLVALALPHRAQVGMTLVRHSPCLVSNPLIKRNCNDQPRRRDGRRHGGAGRTSRLPLAVPLRA